MRIVILGAPGSGKGTQAALVSERYGIPHIMPSELLHGDRIVGQAAHDNPMLEFATKRLRRKDAARGFIIDGFPRTVQHAAMLEEVLTVLKRPLHTALRIAIDADAMIHRLAGRRRCRGCGCQYNIFVSPMRLDGQCDECGGPLHQRVDDTENVIDNRLRVYENLSAQVATFYRTNGLLHDIQGNAPVDEVATRIRAVLDGFATKTDRGRAAIEKVVSAKSAAKKAAATKVTTGEPVTASSAPQPGVPKSGAKKPVKKRSAATKPTAKKSTGAAAKPVTKRKSAVRRDAESIRKIS